MSTEIKPMNPGLVSTVAPAHRPPPPPGPVPVGIGNLTTFTQQSVRNLKESDFHLDSEHLVKLKHDDCMLILFYVENTESHHLCRIWGTVAAQVAGPIFAACNCVAEPGVARAFMALSTNLDHPLRAFHLRQFPTILVYRKGFPQAFYNGDLAVEPLIDYALTLACHPDYRETFQLSASMTPDIKIGMPRPAKYDTPRTTSASYRAAFPVHRPATIAPLPPRPVIQPPPSVAPPPRYGVPIGASPPPRPPMSAPPAAPAGVTVEQLQQMVTPEMVAKYGPMLMGSGGPRP